MATDSENQIFAKIVGYMAANLAAGEDEELPEGLDSLPATLREIATAFETAGGFNFDADQALADGSSQSPPDIDIPDDFTSQL